MWILILGGLIAGTILGILYLAARFSKFPIIQKAAKERKIFCFALGLLPVVLILLAQGWF